MAILSDSYLVDIISVLTVLITTFVIYLKWFHYTYWQRRGLLSPAPSLLFGNSKTLFAQKESFGDFVIKMYNYFKTNKKPHGGFYLLFMRMYMPMDPEIVKHIMQNDFDHFLDRGVYINEEVDPLSAHLFSLEGAKWRNLRVKLSPTFTSGKMKMMFETLVKCGDQLTVEMDKIMDKGAVNIKDILIRFTTDIIGNCAFGIDCNSLKNPDNEFTRNLQSFFVDGFWENIIGFITFVAPEFSKKLGLRAVKPSVSDFFMSVIKNTVDYREKNNIHRKDFMHLLLQLKNRGKLVDDESVLKDKNDDKQKEVALTFEELAAQAFVFFLAGFETSSTTMTFCLFEVASNLDVQEKLRHEINDVLAKHENKFSYDAIMEMNYMEKVINETLRKYPPLPGLNRICNKDYTVPGTNIVIEKGTKVLIPALAMQRDPEYYPNPDKFDPERFSEENKRLRHPYTFIPFGEGPRICIGLRFGMIQTKVGLSVLLKNYKFSVSPKTSLPIELDPRSFIMTTNGGIWLDYTKV